MGTCFWYIFIYSWFIVVGILLIQVFTVLYELRFNLKQFYFNEISVFPLERPIAFDLGWKSMTLLALAIWYIKNRERPVYVIDFETWQPPESWRLTQEQLMTIMKNQNCFNEESLAFLEKMLKQSGVGPKTAWPPGILKCLNGEKSDRSTEAARGEYEAVVFDVVEKLLKKTKTNPKEIDILVINCSLFSPTPSLCSMVINKFGMRSDISSYNLSGMGCSAGLISVELVKNLLAGRPNSTALVVSTEIITQNLYHGNEKSFLLQNTLFRCGGAALLLSNKWTDAHRSLLKLFHIVRTQYVNEDASKNSLDSFGCVFEDEDQHKHRGVRLSKDIVKVAGRAMEKNFTTLGPYVLPVSEQIKTGFWILVRLLVKKAEKYGYKFNKIDPYIPDFKRGVDHFCIHAGGRGVIDGIEKNLNLTPSHVEASRYALHEYGNTSSSSIWYEMDYIRKRMNLRRGQRVLQVGFGSGFKCNSAVWICLNNNSNSRNSYDDDSKSDTNKKNE